MLAGSIILIYYIFHLYDTRSKIKKIVDRKLIGGHVPLCLSPESVTGSVDHNLGNSGL